MQIAKCGECGSTEVEVRAYVFPNDHNSFSCYYEESLAATENCYCHECGQWRPLKVEVVSEDPWRCKECGSLAVQDQVWIDSNTGETMLTPQDKSEYYCSDCQENIYHIHESELMKIIQQWWDAAEIRIKEAVTGIAVAAFAPEDVRDGFDYACDKFWERLTIEEKIGKWRDHK